jgi:two-component system chemotaxis response regulator CheY
MVSAIVDDCNSLEDIAQVWNGLGEVSPVAKVLIVDDSPLLRMMVKDTLTKEGNEVFEAGTIEDALRIFIEVKPDLVMKDLFMPNSDGIEVIHHLKKINPQVKIVVCSTESQKSMIYEAIKAGALDFLIKPLNQKMVALTIRRLVSS